MAFTVRSFGGGSLRTTISADMTNSQTTASLSASPASLGWVETYGANVGSPLGTSGPFIVLFDAGQATEEKILFTGVSGSTLTGGTRAADGGTAYAHTAASAYPVYPVGAALDFYEANQVVAQVLGGVTTAGDLLQATGAGAVTRLAAGATAGAPLISNGAGVGVGYDTSGKSPLIDTGWLNMSGFGTDWTAGTPTPQYRKQGNVVRLRGECTWSSGAGVAITTLPSGYRPTAYWNGVALQAVSTTFTPVYFQITTGGVLNANGFSGTAGSMLLDGLTFTVD